MDLEPRQRKVYEGILRQSRQAIEEAGDGSRRMTALTALLRLRQACCDLRLLPGSTEEDEGAKLAEFGALLEEAVAGGHRVLVFSQFVKLLQAVVPMLAERGMAFSYSLMGRVGGGRRL